MGQSRPGCPAVLVRQPGLDLVGQAEPWWSPMVTKYNRSVLLENHTSSLEPGDLYLTTDGSTLKVG